MKQNPTPAGASPATRQDTRYQYSVYCRNGCGLVELNEAEYERQMWRMNDFWHCPKCGGHAEWNDDSLETNPE